MRHVRYRLLLVASCVAVLTASGVVSAASVPPSRLPLAGTGYQSAQGLIDKGPSDPGLIVTDDLYLNVGDPAGLAAHARSVSTPNSPDYGKYLTPQQIQQRYQLRPEQLNRVRQWLTSAGLTVSQPNWRTLRFTGTLGQLGTAFDVVFHNYADPNTWDHHNWQFPLTDASVPAGVFPLVSGISVNGFPVPTSNQRTGTGTGAPHPKIVSDPAPDPACSRYWGEQRATGVPPVNGHTPAVGICGYTPAQLRHAYGMDTANLTGKGQTVAVIETPFHSLEQDVNTWAAQVGTPLLRPGQLTVITSPDGSPAPAPQDSVFDLIEDTLDVESVHGMAPDADIITIGNSSANYGNVLDSLIYVLDHTHATIATISQVFALNPGLAQAFDQVYQEGALQGVGFYYASGDGNLQPNGSYLNPPATSDWVTGVGGTSLGIGANGSREWETGWGDGESALSPDGKSWQPPANDGGGAGGGAVAGQPRPWYQRGVVSDKEATGPDGKVDRVGPDVAMDADEAGTGMLIGGTALGGWPTTDPGTWRYTTQLGGGTSMAAPLFAGVQALAQQARGGKPLGFANPMLYRLANTRAFLDITGPASPPPAEVFQLPASEPSQPGDPTFPALVEMLGQETATAPGGPPLPMVGPGFDTMTGIGAPTGNYLRMIKN